MSELAGQPAADMDEAAAPIEARLALAQAIAGGRLDEARAATVRRLIAGQVEQARALRRIPLGNADEPEIVFAPFRAPEAEL